MRALDRPTARRSTRRPAPQPTCSSATSPPRVAGKGVQVNAVGTNFMDFPDFLRATGADDPSVRAAVESMVPMHRLGTMEEFASMCLPFIDGTSRFVTGQFVACAGGWA
ncbi:MAG: SDR family oxidoreductase [Microthrixaceae bacterium]